MQMSPPLRAGSLAEETGWWSTSGSGGGDRCARAWIRGAFVTCLDGGQVCRVEVDASQELGVERHHDG